MTPDAIATSDHPAGGVSCPSCGQWLFAREGVEQVRCRCGLLASGDLIREMSYLRDGIPKWTRRLAALEEAIAGRSATPAAPAVGTAPAARTASPVGAHTVLVGLGALLLVAGVVALTVVLWQFVGALGQVALLAGLVVAAGGSAVYASRRIPATGMALSLVAAGCWFTFALLMAHTIDDAFASLAEPEFTVLFAATAALGILAGRYWRMPAWSVIGALAVPVTLASAMALVVARSDSAVAAALSAGALGALGILAIARPEARAVPHRVPIVVATLALAPLFLITSLALSHEPLTVIVVSAVLAGLGVLAASADATRPAGPVLLGVAAGASVGFGFASPWPSVAVVLASAAAGLLVRAWQRFVNPFTGLAAVTVWMVFAWAVYDGLDLGPGADRTDLDIGWVYATLLAGLGLATAVRAWRERSLLELAVSCLLSSSSVLLAVALFAAEPARTGMLEWYTVPLAAELGVYALVASRLHPGLPSSVTLGPSVAVLLIPAALLGVAEDGGTRVYVVMAVAVLVVVVGILLRLLGLLIPSAVALVIVAMEPLGTLASNLPSWVSYSVAGLILLVAGARFEQVRSRARRAGRWAGENLR